MVSTGARRLLKIPKDAVMPASLAEMHDGWFAGRRYKTRFNEGWSFGPRGEHLEGDYDSCIEHDVAQFNFGLDPAMRVCVQCEQWVPIASSFVAMAETDAVLAFSRSRRDKMRGFGRFRSHEEFIAQHADYLSGFRDISPDPEFTRIFEGPKSLVTSFRFYSDEPTIGTVEYSF